MDHAHRPGTAAEANRAVELYRQLGFKVELLRAAPAKGQVNENDLRQTRYKLFASRSKVDNVSILLTAHHADDQAETVLLRILRGTGFNGLAGMPAARPLADFGAPDVELRRPLLSCRAATIRQSLADRGQPWIEDPSNELPEAAARNYLRKQIMPLLSAISTGDPAAAILKLAADADQWRRWVESGFDESGGQDWAGNWASLPQVLRIAAIQQLLAVQGVRCTRTSLADWEQALSKRGSTAVNETHRLSVAGGRLQYLARKDPQQRS